MKREVDKTREFASLAERHCRYSRRAWLLSAPLLGWLALWFVQVTWKVLPIDAEPWLYAFGLAIFCVNAFVWLSRPRLACPACNGPLEHALRTYCPECGCAALDASSGSAVCGACAKTLHDHESGRNYKIRACTHCGCLLDADGI